MKKILFVALVAMMMTACQKGQDKSPQTETDKTQIPIESQVQTEQMDNGMVKSQKSFYGTFDTVIDIMAFTEDQADFEAYFDLAEVEFQRLHRLYDNYNSYEGLNNIYTVNAQAGLAPVEVDPDLLNLILFSIEGYEKTGGRVNIALGPVLSIWHDYREAGIENPAQAQVPPLADLQAANQLTDIKKVIVDQEASTIFLEEAGMSLDLGAVAKGYATELVARKLEAAGLQSAIISAGGNVRTIGVPMDGKRTRWGIGIQNPDLKAQENVVAILYPKEAAIVTSGDYQRVYQVGGQVYHHLIDPETLMPASHFRSVSIMTKDSGLADLWSTALFLADKDEGRTLAEANGIEALWYDMDMGESYTDGMGQILKSNGATSTME